jgi:ethanolamine-phosphate cytidylyltransferase
MSSPSDAAGNGGFLNPKTLSLIIAVGAAAIAVPVMTSETFSSTLPISPYVVTSVLGGAIAVCLYKVLFETETSLNRRLNRIKHRKLEATKPNKPVRIWVDGCFDMMHFGHANAFRQARALGDVLVVGVNEDEDIRKYKGPPTMTTEERTVAVRACKWVDEVVPNAPYVMTDEYLQYIFEKYDIDYVVHGDDPCLLPDGSDVFASAKRAGRYKTIKRTEGVSTTDIVGRMLTMTRDHHTRVAKDSKTSPASVAAAAATGSDDATTMVDVAGASHEAFVRSTTFMPTGRRFIQFSNNRSPKPTDKIVYVDGIWDMFHAGHIDFLEECRKLGDYLIVGVYADDVANRVRGSNYPIMNLHERVLSVLSCRFVDDVVFGAPWKITRDLMVTFNITVVAYGHVADSPRTLPDAAEDPYAVPREMGALKAVRSPRALKTQDIVDRIIAQKVEFEKKFKKKAASEEAYNAQKEFVQEI